MKLTSFISFRVFVSYAFMCLVAAELELDISAVAFVNHAAFVEVSYIYVRACVD